MRRQSETKVEQSSEVSLPLHDEKEDYLDEEDEDTLYDGSSVFEQKRRTQMGTSLPKNLTSQPAYLSRAETVRGQCKLASLAGRAARTRQGG